MASGRPWKLENKKLVYDLDKALQKSFWTVAYECHSYTHTCLLTKPAINDVSCSGILMPQDREYSKERS